MGKDPIPVFNAVLRREPQCRPSLAHILGHHYPCAGNASACARACTRLCLEVLHQRDG